MRSHKFGKSGFGIAAIAVLALGGASAEAQTLVRAEGVPHIWLILLAPDGETLRRYPTATQEYADAVFPGVRIRTIGRQMLEAIPMDGKWIHHLPGFPNHDDLVPRIRQIRTGQHPFRLLVADGVPNIWVVISGPAGSRRFACASADYTSLVFPGVMIQRVSRDQLEAIPADGTWIYQLHGFPPFETLVPRARSIARMRELMSAAS